MVLNQKKHSITSGVAIFEPLNGICALSPTLKNLVHEKLLTILLYGLEEFLFNSNKKTTTSAIKFLKTSERFIGVSFDFLYSKEH